MYFSELANAWDNFTIFVLNNINLKQEVVLTTSVHFTEK